MPVGLCYCSVNDEMYCVGGNLDHSRIEMGYGTLLAMLFGESYFFCGLLLCYSIIDLSRMLSVTDAWI